ncbi:MAG: hypothetical protein KatS3mg077_3370 [Candidatus Binatia bacterium]|nr:MAG: hypothetical protein KatS3mg077_3370 [Candidatus Binatia bacterium]
MGVPELPPGFARVDIKVRHLGIGLKLRTRPPPSVSSCFLDPHGNLGHPLFFACIDSVPRRRWLELFGAVRSTQLDWAQRIPSKVPGGTHVSKTPYALPWGKTYLPRSQTQGTSGGPKAWRPGTSRFRCKGSSELVNATEGKVFSYAFHPRRHLDGSRFDGASLHPRSFAFGPGCCSRAECRSQELSQRRKNQSRSPLRDTPSAPQLSRPVEKDSLQSWRQ